MATCGMEHTADTANAPAQMAKETSWHRWLVHPSLHAMGAAHARPIPITTASAPAVPASKVRLASSSKATVPARGHSRSSLDVACVVKASLVVDASTTLKAQRSARHAATNLVSQSAPRTMATATAIVANVCARIAVTPTTARTVRASVAKTASSWIGRARLTSGAGLYALPTSS